MLLPNPIWRTAVVLLATMGLLVAGYLYYTSFTATGPLGCGEDSGCGAVLSSRWASVFGIPVSLPAALTYLAIIVAVIGLPTAAPRIRPTIWILLSFLAVAILGAAVWFVGLQFLYLHEICPWCMTEHVIGLACAATILVTAWRYAGTDVPQASQLSEPKPDVAEGAIEFKSSKLLTAASLGLLAVAGLVTTQFLQTHTGPAAGRMELAGSVEGEGAGRTVSVLKGQYQIGLADYPTLGSIDAPGIVIVLFDYCCPHCRSTHGYLKNALEKHPDKLGVVMLPMPLNSKCNSHWEKDQTRFAESCELAALALSLWKVAPEHFAAFDDWLFEPSTPRTMSEAVSFSNTLLSDEQKSALTQSDTQQWAAAVIEHDVNLYVDSKAERIPVLVSPNFDAVVGRPGSEEELMEILEEVINP